MPLLTASMSLLSLSTSSIEKTSFYSPIGQYPVAPASRRVVVPSRRVERGVMTGPGKVVTNPSNRDSISVNDGVRLITRPCLAKKGSSLVSYVHRRSSLRWEPVETLGPEKLSRDRDRKG